MGMFGACVPTLGLLRMALPCDICCWVDPCCIDIPFDEGACIIPLPVLGTGFPLLAPPGPIGPGPPVFGGAL